MLDQTRESVSVYLSLGSNIEPEQNLRLACRALSSEFGELRKSAVYRNEAIGFEGGDFLNMVVGFDTSDKPEEIVERLEEIHEQAGREREPGNPYCSRTLDLDLLLYGNMVRQRLKLPHGDIEKYDFVIRPLAEMAPELLHPVSGKAMCDIWDDFDHDSHPLEKVELAID